jgi:hypothetical protein
MQTYPVLHPPFTSTWCLFFFFFFFHRSDQVQDAAAKRRLRSKSALTFDLPPEAGGRESLRGQGTQGRMTAQSSMPLAPHWMALPSLPAAAGKGSGGGAVSSRAGSPRMPSRIRREASTLSTSSGLLTCTRKASLMQVWVIPSPGLLTCTSNTSLMCGARRVSS